MNYVELIQHQAELVFGNKAKAANWLTQPKKEFGGSAPLEHAQSEPGCSHVLEELERINHGYPF